MIRTLWEKIRRRKGRAIAACGLLICAILLCLLLFSGGRDASIDPDQILPMEEEPSISATVTVEVRGCVNAPGLYTLPLGSRVQDAVDAAGGFSDESVASSVNGARRLRDGEQLLFDPSRINLNLADREQLESLPGVGEVLAERILEYREEYGGFDDPSELKRVRGIGESLYEMLKDRISV